MSVSPGHMTSCGSSRSHPECVKIVSRVVTVVRAGGRSSRLCNEPCAPSKRNEIRTVEPHRGGVMRILADSGCVRREVFSTTEGQFSWIDVVAPDRPALRSLTSDFGLPESAAEECLDARTLPKFEQYRGTTFMVLRTHLDPA